MKQEILGCGAETLDKNRQFCKDSFFNFQNFRKSFPFGAFPEEPCIGWIVDCNFAIFLHFLRFVKVLANRTCLKPCKVRKYYEQDRRETKMLNSIMIFLVPMMAKVALETLLLQISLSSPLCIKIRGHWINFKNYIVSNSA